MQSPEKPREAARCLFPLIMRLSKRAADDAADHLRPHGVTPTQFGVLSFLADGSLTAAHLSRLLVLTSTTMTGIIDRLERGGLVTRGSNPGDRRQNPVVLTSAGRSLVERLGLIPVVSGGQLEEALAKLDPADRKELTRLIIQLVVAMGDHEFVDTTGATRARIEDVTSRQAHSRGTCGPPGLKGTTRVERDNA